MSDTKSPLDEIWADAARQFQEICGESLQRGDVKSFDDVRRKIENVNKQASGPGDDQEDKWDKAKSVGLQSLKFMKLLLGAASQAATFIPVPTAAANIAGSALSFVFDIPEKIKGYNDAVDNVFTDVSSALSQFQIYESMESIPDPAMVRQIHLVMVSIVIICAHVVKYRQGRRRDRLRRQIASIFDDNKPLDAEMSKFQQALQAQRDVEGTVTLSVLVETRSGVAQLLEGFAVFSQTVEETHQGVQALKDDNDRTKTLIKIRNTLQVPITVRLDTRTTQTCTNIAAKCLPGTGAWIWTDHAFTAWTQGTAQSDGKKPANVLILSGPPSSGKTLAAAQIVKRLEEEQGRTYIAHYFFPPDSSKKTEDSNKYPVHTALRYMAFQIARVDATVRKALGKACDSPDRVSVLSRNSASKLDSLWSEFKIGVPGSGATYYLAFDGIENLDEKEREMLHSFIFGVNLTEQSEGRVRILVSGTEKLLDNDDVARSALHISMESYNGSDMRLFIEDRLNKQGLLRHAKPGSVQQKAKDDVIAKLPQKAAGSYSQLQFALDEVVRLLSSRTSTEELEKVLDQPMNSHATAIKALQRSLTIDEVGELNELLKWVHFGNERMTVDELEAAMLLYSGTESIGRLDDIISSKYLAVLKIDDSPDGPFVEGQDGALEYLQKERDHKERHAKDQPTISMTININNVDQEIVGHFLWDLAQKAIRDQFRFNFDSASNTLHTSQSTIAVDAFEANHTLVMRALKYLSGQTRDETNVIGRYLFWWLPYHLAQLTQLDYEEKGNLMPDEQLEIGQHLYQLFKDQEAFKRHRAIVERYWWTADEMQDVQKWLMNSAVVRRLPRQWREEVQRATSPVRGYLRPLVKMILERWLRDGERQTTETVVGCWAWVREFLQVDEKTQAPPQTPNLNSNGSAPPTPADSSETPEIDWDHVSQWCQNFLELADSDLDSLWWARIAQTASTQVGENPELLMPLLKRSLEKVNPSWNSRIRMADCHFLLGNIEQAISDGELALKEIQADDARPTPEEENLMFLHCRLGDYQLRAGNTKKAAEHYLLVSKSSDDTWAESGQVAYMKAIVSSDDTEAAIEMLRSVLTRDASEGSMSRVLKLIARDASHAYTISKMFTIAKNDVSLLEGLVASLEAATTPPALDESKTAEMSENDRFAEQEARGVLLYHRGVAVAYGLYPGGGAGNVSHALPFWNQARDQLQEIGGSVASTTRTNATADLAKYYFDTLLADQGPQEHFDALSKLAEEDSTVDMGDAAGYLAALNALRGDKDKARAILSPRIKFALEVLSDGQPDNDYLGHRALFKSLGHYRDFENSAAALALLGSPDLLTDAFHFSADDITDGEETDKSEVLNLVEELAKQTLVAVKAQIPDSQQIRRMEAAKAHIDALSATDPEHASRATALEILQDRVSSLLEGHALTMEIALSQYGWLCNGVGPPGTMCDKVSDFDTEFYHCIYCSNYDFCPECFRKLREGSTLSPQCSAEHVWIKCPRQGSDFYRGANATRVRVPVVRFVEGDERVLEACYHGDEGAPELSLEEWKVELAKEWDIRPNE